MTETGLTIPPIHDSRVLRHVEFESPLSNLPKMRLLVWDTDRTDSYHKSILGYAFWPAPTQLPLFSGEDFGCSPAHCVDSDDTLLTILSFLTLRPGDTDREYFDSYTSVQLDWAKSHLCEALQFEVSIAEEESNNTFFRDIK